MAAGSWVVQRISGASAFAATGDVCENRFPDFVVAARVISALPSSFQPAISCHAAGLILFREIVGCPGEVAVTDTISSPPS